jgi:hypothetical protein
MDDSENTLRNQSPSSEPNLKERRSFLGALLGLGSAFVAALLSVPLARFALFPDALRGLPVWRHCQGRQEGV